jgi:hypothetical protein
MAMNFVKPIKLRRDSYENHRLGASEDSRRNADGSVTRDERVTCGE